MTFPLWYILIPLLAIVLFAGLFLFFNLFHLARYAVDATRTYVLMGAYVGSFVLVLCFTAYLLLPFDWTSEVSLSDLIPFSNENSEIYGL